jgi:C4-dicarboxylate-specific signal transduction histidine kinase
MFVNYRTPHRFSEIERTNTELFASQAAVAISNAQLFEQEQKRSRALKALHVGSQQVTRSLDEKKILGRIAQQAWRIANSQGQPANFADIRLVKNGKVCLEAVYPQNIMLQIGGKLKAEIDLQKGLNSRIGIIGRAIKRKATQSVPDVASEDEEDYIEFHPSTRSELVVPIMIGDEVSGIINVEHPHPNAFDEKDEDTFESLAAQASIAIQNARRYADLQRTIELLKARTSLAWMGLASSVWRHDIDRYVSTLEDHLAIMREMLKQKMPVATLNKHLGKALESIRQVKQKSITVPAFTGKGVPPQRLCRLIDERLEKLQKREPYRSVKYVSAHAAGNGAIVKVNLYWLRQALDHLIDNAIDAMKWSQKKELTIAVRQGERRCEICITDSGTGIPKKLQRQMFVGPVEKTRQAKGLGYGLLQAQAIIQRYEGDINLVKTNSKGTTMTIWLPLETENTAAS